MIEKVTGFIVNTVEFRDTSLVLTIITKEYGLIGVMARGVKSLKSKLRTSTQKFTYGYFYIYYKPDKLSTLKDVDVIDPLYNMHNDIIKIGFLNYLSELVTQVYRECESNELFPLFIETILKMNEGFDVEVLANIFEIKCLPYLGVGIVIDECILCGSKKNIVTIDGDKGGLICQNCYKNEKLVSIKTIKLLRIYSEIDIKSIKKLEVKEENKVEINIFLNEYYDRYTGMYLKSKEFIESMKKI